MIVSGSSIKQLMMNLVHFENSIVLITGNYLVTSQFCLENPCICKKIVTIIATVTEVVVLGVTLIVVGALMKFEPMFEIEKIYIWLVKPMT